MWYADKFTEAVSRPNARLMVIGYGFGDGHINQLIYEAWEKGGRTLSMFIVHPDGREILKKVNPTYGKGIYCPGPLEVMAWRAVFLAKKRLLTRSMIAKFGGIGARAAAAFSLS
jgi:hypothetical protein